jgi:hypothetical protein
MRSLGLLMSLSGYVASVMSATTQTASRLGGYRRKRSFDRTPEPEPDRTWRLVRGSWFVSITPAALPGICGLSTMARLP